MFCIFFVLIYNLFLIGNIWVNIMYLISEERLAELLKAELNMMVRENESAEILGVDFSEFESVTSDEWANKYFSYKHLPPRLQDISSPICAVALHFSSLKANDEDEKRSGLRKLLEAKDSIVRAFI